MKIIQQRIQENSTELSTISALFVDDRFECNTLEDTDRYLEVSGAKAYGKTAIPRGIYKIVRDMSPHFGYVTPRFLDVPQFTNIRCHKGNKPTDTEGCILVGTFNIHMLDWVSQSARAFKKLDAKIAAALERGEEVTWEIV